jgi:curved DNA-binding protein CbpA
MEESPLNYYQILESSPTATAEEIRTAYKKLALQYHPDRVSNLSLVKQQVAIEKMKQLSNAYATLKDPEKRTRYDQQLLMNTTGFARQPYGSTSQNSFYTYRSANYQVRRINPLLFLLIMVAIFVLVGYFLFWLAPVILIIIGINILLNILRRL